MSAESRPVTPAGRAAPGPLVWLLIGPKSGDNAQVRTLAEALVRLVPAMAVREIPLAFRHRELVLHVTARPTLAGLDRVSRTGIHGPWPDLVLTAGRRNELVALWIRRQSGGRSRVVHLGRPWTHPRRFDLVVSTPQYAVPPAANVMVNALPLHRLDAGALAAAAAAWQDRLPPLPRPWVALLVGGDSGDIVFTPALAERLAAQVNAYMADVGGGLLVTTSPRTPGPFQRALWACLREPRFACPWSPVAGENPYLAFLALADRLIVTAESVSMVAEAVATGKPTLLADVTAPGPRPWWLETSSYRWKPLTHRLAMRLAPKRFTRDVGRIHRELRAAGRIRWLDETARAADRTPPRSGRENDMLTATAERVLELLAGRQSG